MSDEIEVHVTGGLESGAGREAVMNELNAIPIEELETLHESITAEVTIETFAGVETPHTDVDKAYQECADALEEVIESYE